MPIDPVASELPPGTASGGTANDGLTRPSTGGGNAPRRLQLAAVNGWRGPGALAIALAHLGVATDFFSYRHIEPMAPLVDLFFVISGLVIAQAYSAKLAQASAIPEYVVRRVGRIWPVQAATLMILVAYECSKLVASLVTGGRFSSAAFARTGINLPEAIPTNLLLIQSLGLHDRETWNFPSWSLSVEFVTYISFAAFCILRPRLRQILSVVTIVASIAILVTLAPYGMRSTYDYAVFRCFAGFFAGTLCFDAATHWRLPTWLFPTLVEVAVVSLTIVWLGYSAGTYAAFAAPIVFSAFVLAFVNGRGLLSRLLSTAPLQIFADWSFSIYMVHALVLLVLLATLHSVARQFHLDLFMLVANPLARLPGARAVVEVVHLNGPLLQAAMIATYITVVFAASYAAYRLVEVPGRAVFGRWAKRLAPKLSVAAGVQEAARATRLKGAL